NAIGLDVSAFGNHEFDKGQEGVNDRVLPPVDRPYLAANIYDEDGNPGPAQHARGDPGGVARGVSESTTEVRPPPDSPAGLAGPVIGDMTEAVNAVAADLAAGDTANGEADVLVVLVHDGAPSPDLSSADGTPYGDLIANVDDDVSAIISGHTHQPYAVQVGEVWVTQTGQYGERLGQIGRAHV